MQTVNDAEIDGLRAKKHWPWPLALAYAQERRFATIAAVSEVLAIYPKDATLSSFTASSAVARIYEVVTGNSRDSEAVEGIDKFGESYTIKCAEAVYWDSVSELERDLVGALELGQLRALGRPAPDGKLTQIEPEAWVGAEISPEATSDLVIGGWRTAGLLSQALKEIERKPTFYDVHLIGDAVTQWADALEDERKIRTSDRLHAADFERIDEIEREDISLVRGYWSLLVSGAWIASRSEQFTAAVQQFEQERHCERGGLHSGTAYYAIGDLMAKRGWQNLTQSLDILRLASLDGQLPGASGRASILGGERLIPRNEWRQWRGPHHEHGGVSVLPGVFNVGFPAEEVIAVFPIKEPHKILPHDFPKAPDQAEINKVWAEWADDAAVRNVSVTNARKDATEKLGEQAPKQDTARDLLRKARQHLGNPVGRGRPVGSKSFAGRRN